MTFPKKNPQSGKYSGKALNREEAPKTFPKILLQKNTSVFKGIQQNIRALPGQMVLLTPSDRISFQASVSVKDPFFIKRTAVEKNIEGFIKILVFLKDRLILLWRLRP